MKTHEYFTYITTNLTRRTLYIGVTDDLSCRMTEHFLDSQGPQKSFAGKYRCYHLIYFELFPYIEDAIRRETELKKWSRAKKVALIAKRNPNWVFLNA